MYRSTYIPVNEDCVEGVYLSNRYFDGKRLRAAVRALTDPDSASEYVNCDGNAVTFADDATIAWPLYEVYMAHKMLEISDRTGFWFHPISDVNGIVQLFVSDPFHDKILLVNALTCHTLIITNKAHQATIHNLLGKEHPYMRLQRMFDMFEGIELNRIKLLSAVRVSAPEGDMYMVTNPFTYPFHDDIYAYGVDLLEEMDQILSGKVRKTESLEILPAGIRRHDSPSWPIIPREQAKLIVDTYKLIVANKSSYVAIYDQNMEDYLYWSTNKRYLVRADTLECVVVQNAQVKRLLTTVCDGGGNEKSSLDLIWRLAGEL